MILLTPDPRHRCCRRHRNPRNPRNRHALPAPLAAALLAALTAVLAAPPRRAAAEPPPSWAVGTFDGFSRYRNVDVEMVLLPNGRAYRYYRDRQGRITESVGNYLRSRLVFGGDEYDVSRSGGSALRVRLRRIAADAYTLNRVRNGWGQSGGGNRPPNPSASLLRISAPREGETIRERRVALSGSAPGGARDVRIEVFERRSGRRVANQSVAVKNGRWSTQTSLDPGRYRVLVQTTSGGPTRRAEARFAVEPPVPQPRGATPPNLKPGAGQAPFPRAGTR